MEDVQRRLPLYSNHGDEVDETSLQLAIAHDVARLIIDAPAWLRRRGKILGRTVVYMLYDRISEVQCL